MGQRAGIASLKRSTKNVVNTEIVQSTFWYSFETELGWFGMLGQDELLCRLMIGHSSKKMVTDQILKMSPKAIEEDWNPELRETLQQYALGEKICFDRYPLNFSKMTAFQKSVVQATMKIPYGQTISYGELAKRVGSPKAARAVGTVMSRNRIPILMPCHRVVGANGDLGGFSAPQGTTLKQRMLQLEAESTGTSSPANP